MPAKFSSSRLFTPAAAVWRAAARRAVCLACILFFLASCTGNPLSTVAPVSVTVTEPADQSPMVEVTYKAQLLNGLGTGQNLYLEILDEVTGLALNVQKVKMDKVDDLNYQVKLPVNQGSVVKYRYTRDNAPTSPIEYTSRSQQVRYRLHYADFPGTVQDVISGWKNELPGNTAQFGRIQGNVAIKGTNSPVVNAMVTAGGVTTFSASDGSFLLEGLPPGTHNLLAYSLDGGFQVFQQGAVVATESTTPAQIRVEPAKMVSVTFSVSAPEGSVQGLPIRLVGNIYPLGNTFADLRGGVSVLASRAPLMQPADNDQGKYTLTLKLPAGLDLRYKYTLGDGFWNAEHGSKGEFKVRQLIVPTADTTLTDTIATWSSGGGDPVTFTVAVPGDTPATDIVSIQFNPYGWTEPLPMWPSGSGKWFYMLYSPLNLIKSAPYRYCRNDQCGAADALSTQGPNPTVVKTYSTAEGQRSANDQVDAWAWWGAPGQPVTVASSTIAARGQTFVTGMEFSPDYRPGYQPYMPWAMQSIKDTGANTAVLAPTWRWTYLNPPVIEPVAGSDPLWQDLTGQVNLARQQGLGIVVHPVMRYSGLPEAWWQSGARDANWWQSWYDRYRTFLLYHADLANQAGATAFVLGDDTILPALPGGTLADGSSSGAPENAADHWATIIADVRARYKGSLVWYAGINGTDPVLPEFLADLDGVYAVISTPLDPAGDAPASVLEERFAAILDDQVKPLADVVDGPVYVALLYPSAPGAQAGCVKQNDNCMTASELMAPGFALAGAAPDLNAQADIYNSALVALNDREWIDGFIAAGYYPGASLKDNSTSVRSKPAADVLWYWYPRLTGSGGQ